MKSLKSKICIGVMIFITILMIHLTVNATNDDIAILKTQGNEYILYLEQYLGQEFYFAFSNNQNAKEGDADNPLNFITSKQDNKGNQVAYIATESTTAYMWVKVNDSIVMARMPIDFTQSISEEKINELSTITQKIPVDTTETKTEQITENDTIKTITQGIIKITDTEEANYYYSAVLLTKDTTNYNRLMEIQQKLSENLNTYEEILLYQEYEGLFDSMVKATNWTEAKDRIIELPATANDGEKYAVLMKKEVNGVSTYDIQFLTSYKSTEQSEIEKVVSTKQNAELPITYDNPILMTIFGIGVVLLIIVFLRIKSLSRKHGKHERKH